MLFPLTLIKSGSATIKRITISKASTNKIPYYVARISFDNSQTFFIPLYIPFLNADCSTEKRALDLANSIAKEAALEGRIDIVELILNNQLPFREYLKFRLNEVCLSLPLDRLIQFSSFIHSLDKYNDRYRRVPLTPFFINFFVENSNEVYERVAINVPVEFGSTELTAFLNSEVDKVLGKEMRRRSRRQSVDQSSLPPETIIYELPRMSLLRPLPFRKASISFELVDNNKSFILSLSTRNMDVASQCMNSVILFISNSLNESKTVTVGGVQDYIKQLADVRRTPTKKSRKIGPIIIYRPIETGAAEKLSQEAIRIYLALSGSELSGQVFLINVVPPGGAISCKAYTAVISVLPGRLSDDQAESMRCSMRAFIEHRLNQFFQAGGAFHDMEQMALNCATVKLSSRDIKRFHTILEGRLNSSFVKAALDTLLFDPFSDALSSAAIYRLGGFRPFLQPAHPCFHLENTREVRDEPERTTYHSTLHFSQADGQEFRYQLKFSSLEALNDVIKSIDRLTTHALQKKTPLVSHALNEILRKLTRPYLDASLRNL